MADPVLTVDGYDLSLLGFQVEALTGWRDGLDASWPEAAVPGRFGPLVTGTDPSYAARKITVNGAIVADNLTAMLAAMDDLKWRIGRTEKEFAFVDDVTRVFNARVTGVRVTGLKPQMTQRGTRLAITFYLPDPRIWDDAPTVVSAIVAADKDLPLGTAPVRATIQVTGVGTFTLTYKNSGGATIATMTITGATAPVDIDMDAQTITDAGGNAIGFLTAGNFFAFDPDDGVYPTDTWPTLQCSSGTAVATYTKAYL